MLFSNFQLKNLVLKNRLIFPPIATGLASYSGFPTPEFLNYYRRISSSGVAAVIVEAAYIDEYGRGWPNGLGLANSTQGERLKQLAELIRSCGAIPGIQLFHAGRMSPADLIGGEALTPSKFSDPYYRGKSRQISLSEIASIVKAFALAARRAQEAGFEIIELHGAHGYLINQFLSPLTNKRRDYYGGSFENRLRFAREVTEAVRDQLDDEICLQIRISADEFVDGGLNIEASREIVRYLMYFGLDSVHVSAGIPRSLLKLSSPIGPRVPEGNLLKLSRYLKDNLDLPIIGVGKIKRGEIANNAITEGYADLVAVGRAILRDPAWPDKVRDGDLTNETILPCLTCPICHYFKKDCPDGKSGISKINFIAPPIETKPKNGEIEVEKNICNPGETKTEIKLETPTPVPPKPVPPTPVPPTPVPPKPEITTPPEPRIINAPKSTKEEVPEPPKISEVKSAPKKNSNKLPVELL